MNKFFISILSIFVFASISLDAAVYKGQREFVENCVKCHKTGQVFIATKKKREWSVIMRNKGEKLAKLHLQSKDKNSEPSFEYFESKIFNDNSKHLKDFLLEYASDSGNIPACN